MTPRQARLTLAPLAFLLQYASLRGPYALHVSALLSLPRSLPCHLSRWPNAAAAVTTTCGAQRR